MKKNLLTLCLSLFVAASTMLAQAEAKMTYRETYGNHMNPSAGCQSKDYYFYNAQGQVVRHVFHTANVSGNFEVQNVYYYTFDDNGRLIHLENYQYRPAYSDWKLSEETTYEYDEAGNVLVEINSNKTYRYTYDADGNTTRCQVLVTGSDYMLEDITYFDFVEGVTNKPRAYESVGAYSSYTYSGTIEYDEQYRVVVDDRLTSTGSKMQRIEYAYDDNGVCVSEAWFTSPSWTPEAIEAGSAADTLQFSKDIKRTLIDGKYYKYTARSYEVVDFDANYNNIYAWVDQSTAYHEYYANMNADTAPYELSLQNVSTAAEPNAVKITAQAPAIPGLQYIVWRNWEAVATVEAVDGVIEYVDHNVESREHTYFVQAYDPANNIYYNVTDLVTINMLVELVPVTKIELVAGRKDTAKDGMTGATYDTYIITLKWEAPVCDFAVKEYQVFQKPFAMPVATVAGDVLTVELSMPDTETAEIRIDAVYELGTATGEYVTFTWDKSKDFDVNQPADVLTLVKQTSGGEVIVNLYNKENNIYRTKTLMSLNDGSYGPDYQYYYNYVNGLLDEYYYIQYKDMGVWTDYKNHTYYEYDAQGRLVREENIYTYNLYEYEYDEQGRLVSYTRYGKYDRTNPDAPYDKLYETITYSQFDANNNPLRMDCTDHLYPTSSYFVFYTYDDNGNVLVEEAWTPDFSTDDETDKVEYYKYENVYDENGINVECIKSNGNWDGPGFIYASREVRTKVSDNQYDYTYYNYSEREQKWTEYRSHNEYYAVLDGAYAPRNLSVTYVNNPNYVNAVQLSCIVPEKEVPNAKYIVWQDWQPVDTIAPFNGRISYVAENLENGRDIEFTVQSYDAVNDVLYNAADVVVANYTIELPPVTNLRYIKTTEGSQVDGQGGSFPVYWVHFEWDAPASDLEIKHYNVYEEGWAVPMTTTANTCDSLSVYRDKDFNSPDQQKEIGVQVSVEYVIGESELVTERFAVQHSGIEQVVVTDAYVDGNNLYANAVAQVAIYNLAGVEVINRNDVTSIDLSELPAGAYVASVVMGDKLQIIKFVRR